MKSILIFIVILSVFLSISCFAASEVRGIWINSDAVPKTKNEAREMVREYHRAGINLLFPEMICRGYAVFPSKILERDPRFVTAEDMLPAMIDEAHKYGMEVHPWVWAFRAGYTKDKGSIIKNHPEWLDSSKYGETLSINGGMWLSPVIPECRDYLLSLYKELAVNYNIDGFHLDYIRYETQNPVPYGYNKSACDKFQSLYGIDPLNIDYMTSDYLAWVDFRSMYLDVFVQTVYRTMKSINPNIIVSAAVANNPGEARQNYCQNWGHWADNNWIDMIIPMTYTDSDQRFNELMSLQLNRINGKVITAVGIGSLNFTKNEKRNIVQIEQSRKVGYMGQALFASAYYTKSLGDLLKADVYNKNVSLPYRDINNLSYKTVLTYKDSVNSYIPNLSPAVEIPDVVLAIPCYSIKKAKAPIVVDGKVTDAEWAGYDSAEIDRDNWGNPVSYKTQVKAVWDDDGLIISYVCDEPDMNAVKAEATNRDGWTFYDDSVEVFVNMNPKSVKYNHFSVNTLNTHFDQQIYNTGWNKDWESGIDKQANSWSCEMKIPFEQLSVPVPKIGENWKINFTRNRWVTKNAEYLNWSVVYGGFHTLDRFGEVTFTE